MFKKIIRPYEMSLWTLQDSFITVLKSINTIDEGQLETPKIRIKNDGTQELSFSIPMYYRKNGELIENPIWFNTQNGVLLVNLRKIKVIFNKGEKGEEVFEYVINKVTETHTDGQLHCEVFAEGLAFQELGKIGYKISLSEQDFFDEYEKWEKGEYSSEEDKKKAEPISNLQFWCDRMFKNSKWIYSIQMDWSIYDGVINTKLTDEEREEKGLRRTDKIYEEEYISSWELDSNENLIPSAMENFKEKARLVSLEKSNFYNNTQTLAKTFGVYCKYKYHYDENYHIIKKECIFYNNFLDEQSGKIDINYPYSTSKIEREIDSSDVITKMFVVPIEDENSASGLVTIADVAANKSKEDYILNFDYLYSIGTISDEQYNTIPEYERAMFIINSELEPISAQIAKLEQDLVDYKADYQVAINGQQLAKEQMDQADKLLNSITNGNQVLEKTKDNPYRAVLIEDTAANNDTYFLKISQEGVYEPKDKNFPIKIYYDQKVPGESTKKNRVEYTGNYKIIKDENGNIIQLNNITLPEDAYYSIFYLTFTYRPQLHYENVYNTFALKLLQEENAAEAASSNTLRTEESLKKAKEDYENLLKKKEETIAEFENMMGPAIKEGSWQTETPKDYGSKYTENATPGLTIAENKFLQFIWSKKAFEEEQKNYYEESVNQSKVYYPCIKLTKEYLKSIKNNLDTLSFIYNNDKEQMAIGSQAQFGFLQDKTNTIIPILMLTDTKATADEILITPKVGLKTTNLTDQGVEATVKTFFEVQEADWIDSSKYTFVYPRLQIKSLLLKTSDEELYVKIKNGRTLEKFYDYSILQGEDEAYYITLKNNVMLEEANVSKTFEVNYTLSNAALSLYLDALEVSKTNAFPQVSYTVDVSGLNTNFIMYAYQKLNKIVNINDSDLKFQNVQGYISELDLNLDRPWEDTITTQNYKTKFEDLFSTIVASSEQMKANAFSYSVAAGAFTSGGTLKNNVIQNTINKVDLSYAFQNGDLTIDETNGIWATSDAGVVAMRGGGIFCATQKDSYGNWVWNTGITPSGINASLIKAGQIDTNLIKIYAGDNLRLQLNADGLFAYRSDAIGEANLNEYVVHNSDGLFLTNVNGNSKINRVEISWQGLILRNKKGEQVFYADPNTGNLVIAGGAKIEKGSEIAGWYVGEKALSSKNGRAHLISDTERDEEGNPITEPYDILRIEGEKGEVFKVESDATLYTNNIVAKGTISGDSFISNMRIDSLGKAVKTISIYSIGEGDAFKLYNPNLDGVITTDPNYLRFRIMTNALTDEEMLREGNEKPIWKFYYCLPEDKTLKEALDFIPGENESDIWIEIDQPSETNTNDYFKFDNDGYLTFIVKSGIMYLGDNNNGEDLIYFKVELEGRKNKLDEEQQVILDEEGHTEFEDEIYRDGFMIQKIEYGTDKRLSQIDPPSYTFIGSQETPYEESATFTVILKNIDMGEGTWNLGGEDAVDEYVISGNSESDSSAASKQASLVIVPEIDLNDGLWFIGDTLVQSGNTLNGDDEIKEIFSEDNKVIGYQIIDENDEIISTILINEDGTIKEGAGLKEKYNTENIVIGYEILNGEQEAIGEIGINQNRIIIKLIFYNEKGFTITNEKIDEETAISTITVPSSMVPEGGQLLIRYSIVDKEFKISATRSAFAFKIKNGVDGVLTIISSTNGSTFRNGAISTTLEAELYKGAIRLNDKDESTEFTDYYYLWKKKEEDSDEYDIVEGREHLKSRFLVINNNDFKNKAIYCCDIYNNYEEAEKEYNIRYGEENKE